MTEDKAREMVLASVVFFFGVALMLADLRWIANL